MSERRVVIVGGGISGLAIAEAIERHSQKAGASIRSIVLEADAHVGGKIRSAREDGFVIDTGPHGFLDKEPKMFELIERLALGGSLVGANGAAERRFVVRAGKLRALPSSPPAFLLSDVLPLSGKLRVLFEPFAGARPQREESVWDFAARRIGRQAADVLIDAMVTGIYGGDPKQLSLKAAFPRMFELETEHGSLIKAQIRIAREKRRALGPGANAGGGAGGPTGTLHTFKEGLGEITSALAARTEVRTSARVERLERIGGRFRVLGGGLSEEADAVVLAVPAYDAEALCGAFAAEAAARIGGIPYAPVAVIVQGFARADLTSPLDGFGFLIPHGEGRSILGSIWASSVFPVHVPNDSVMLRTIIGGSRRPELLGLDDGQLLALARADLQSLAHVPKTAVPRLERVIRWPKGIPQYQLGHEQRVSAADAIERELSGVFLTGNAYRGVAMLSCVAEADRVGERVVRRVIGG